MLGEAVGGAEHPGDEDELDEAPEGLGEELELGDLAVLEVLEREGHGEARDPDEEGQHEICDIETVPDGVLQEPVAAAAVVDKDHEAEREAAEDIDADDAGALLGRGLVLLLLLDLLPDIVDQRRFLVEFLVEILLPLAAAPLPAVAADAAGDQTADHAEHHDQAGVRDERKPPGQRLEQGLHLQGAVLLEGDVVDAPIAAGKGVVGERGAPIARGVVVEHVKDELPGAVVLDDSVAHVGGDVPLQPGDAAETVDPGGVDVEILGGSRIQGEPGHVTVVFPGARQIRLRGVVDVRLRGEALVPHAEPHVEGQKIRNNHGEDHLLHNGVSSHFLGEKEKEKTLN